MIKLGSKVKDPVTGFTGTAVARTEYAWGCVSVGVCSNELHEGKPIDWQWFDEKRLAEDADDPTPGGLQPNAPQR